MVPRESVTETIVVESTYEARRAVLFATVNEITVGTNGEVREFISPVMTDRTNTVTSWIEIDRGRIEIDPGQAVEIPLSISTHPFAEPGEYHVFIGFVESKRRMDAEAVALAGDANGVIVKVTIGDERQDVLRVVSMVVDRIVSRPDERVVDITIENSGDLLSAPTGELIFYDGRGREVVSVPVNQASEAIAPNTQKTFSVAIPLEQELGQFKANLNLKYGNNQRASLYDTTSFFMLPLHYLLLLLGFFVTLIGLLLLFSRRTQPTDYGGHESGDEVSMYVRDGHVAKPQDHDIDLKK